MMAIKFASLTLVDLCWKSARLAVRGTRLRWGPFMLGAVRGLAGTRNRSPGDCSAGTRRRP